MRLLPLIANGQLAAAMYMRAGDVHVPFQLHVLDVHGAKVSHVVAFLDDALFHEIRAARFAVGGSHVGRLCP
jgi:RNA polymerase sigma-70 factor (ECF subfamily)